MTQRDAVKTVLGLALGAAILGSLSAGRALLELNAALRRADVRRLDQAVDDASYALGQSAALEELKRKDIQDFKAVLAKLTASHRALYEAGLQLQEEQRLLEKQWEIMTTYLVVDEEEGKISVMRGDQVLVTYLPGYAEPREFGGAEAPEPASLRIISKQRFASPEQGKYELVGGKLQWEPPQVGSSMRANALGQYVLLTDGPLILHGPPKRRKEHAAFRHACLGLSLDVARRLYEKTFIGTRIFIRPPSP
jgi:hypothetical protein